MVVDANYTDETAIRIRFNHLCQQFIENKKYIPPDEEYMISNTEDISYEINVHNKRYQAVFYQKPESYYNDITALYSTKYTQEQIENPTDEIQNDLIRMLSDYIEQTIINYSVWFMIDQNYGKYGILMYYDNEYNKANGEDL